MSNQADGIAVGIVAVCLTGIRSKVVGAAAILVALMVTGCGSAAVTTSSLPPSSAPNPYAQAQAQANVNTCNAFGNFLLEIPTNTDSDVSVVDAADGGNGVTEIQPTASPALQALVNEWDDQVQDFYANNGNNDTTGPAVEKTDRLVTEYGDQMEAWCAAHAGVNLSGDGSTSPTVWATEGP